MDRTIPWQASSSVKSIASGGLAKQHSQLCWLLDVVGEIYLLKQISLLEITSTVVLLANVVVVVVDLLESSMLLTQPHFKLPTGAHMPLVEH